MSRRRAAREQEKQDFLQQNPELITNTTRIEVAETTIPVFTSGGGSLPDIDTFEPVYSVNDGPFEPAPFINFLQGEHLALADVIFGPSFSLVGFNDLEFEPEEIEEEDLAFVSMSGRGFGVTSQAEVEEAGEDLEEFGEEVEELNGDNLDAVIQFIGADSISSDETLGLEVRFFEPKKPDLRSLSLEDEEEEDEGPGGLSLGLDFTATGRGAVSVTLFEDEEDEIGFTQTYQVPNGAGIDDVMNALFTLPEEDVFQFAAISTTGSLEISVVGIDLETNFEPDFILPS